MGLILSVQSHVAYGYVGNRAAMPPLNALGHEVIALNTVSFSNHTGYGQWTGEVHDVEKLAELIKGIKAQGLFSKIDAVLTGYIGNHDLGALILDTVQEIQNENPDCHYCCDPVMGDTAPGFFVHETIPPFFKDEALQKADILVPNQFEASYLSGVDIQTKQDALTAIDKLHKLGAERIVITSFKPDSLASGQIAMLVSDPETGVHQITTPLIDMSPMPNGAGDVTAATVLGHILNGLSLTDAIEHTASALHELFKKTKADERRELSLIKALDLFKAQDVSFKVEAL